MSDITTFYQQEFERSWEKVSAQRESRLLGAITRADFQGPRKSFNMLEDRSMKLVTERKGDTPDGDTDAIKYWLFHQKYEDVISFDEDDDFNLGQIVLPDSAEVTNQAEALNRTADDVIISSFEATRYIGETGTTSEAFSSTYSVAVNYVYSGSAANSGLTIPKLRRAKYLMDNGEIPESERFLVYGARQIDDLLATTEVGSRDYNDAVALKEGRVDRFMGFNFIRSERLPHNAGTDVRTCYAFHKAGIKASLGRKRVHIDIRTDKRHRKQIRTVAQLGAVRTENSARVVRIYADESP